MGMLNSANKRSMEVKVSQLAHFAGVDNMQLSNLKSEFMRISKNGRMGKKEFMGYYGKIESIGGTYTTGEALKLFNAMDTDNNGYITFDEFLTGLIILHGQGNPQDKLIFTVETYAGPNAEYIDTNQAEYVLNKFHKLYAINTPTSAILPQLFRNQTSRIPTKQFVQSVVSLPTYSQYFRRRSHPNDFMERQELTNQTLNDDSSYGNIVGYPAAAGHPAALQQSTGFQFPRAGEMLPTAVQYSSGEQYVNGPQYNPLHLQDLPQAQSFPRYSSPPLPMAIQYSNQAQHIVGQTFPETQNLGNTSDADMRFSVPNNANALQRQSNMSLPSQSLDPTTNQSPFSHDDNSFSKYI